MKLSLKNERPHFSLRKKLLLFFVAFFCLMLLTALYIALAHRGTASLLDDMLAENEALEAAGEKLNLLDYHTANYLNTGSSENYDLYRETAADLAALTEEADVSTLVEFEPLLKGVLQSSEDLIEGVQTNSLTEPGLQEEYQQFSRQIDITTRYLNNAVNANNRQANRIYAASWDLVNRMERSGLLMAATLALFSLIFLYLFSENIIRPLYSIIDQSRQLAEGNFALSPIEVDTRDELSYIARAFNMMTAELEALFTELQEKLAVERELQQKEVENLKMKNLLKEAELKKLQSQINPHFLFNTLNSISQLAVLEDADRTGEMITKVAEHFRRNLRRSEELITVEEELRSVHLYCDILHTRFGEGIEFSFDYEDDVLDEQIPPLTIQPLVENAFLHGIKEAGSGSGHIEITIRRRQQQCQQDENQNGDDREKWLEITVRDDGSGMEQKLVEEILQEEKIGGLSNIKERLRLFYQRDDLLDIETFPGRGTRVMILIPPAVERPELTEEEK